MKALVAGGTGLIGSNLAETLSFKDTQWRSSTTQDLPGARSFLLTIWAY